VWVPGACWKHLEGPPSNLKERENYPVVQVAWGRRGRLCGRRRLAGWIHARR
jgi:hypothetical protein